MILQKQYIKAIEKSNIISKTDTKGLITFVNDEFCTISGYSKNELIGKNHNIVRHPDVPSSKFKLLWDTIKSKHIYKTTVKNLAKDGSTFYVNTTVIPILDENGNIAEFVAIRYDVTKEMNLKNELQSKEIELQELNKTLEKKVQEKTKQLKQLNLTLENRVKEEIAKNEEKQRIMFWQSRMASLGQMLANIAHQWRQPITELNLVIFGMKKAILDKNEAMASKLYIESQDIIKNLSNTIDNFTNFFKPNKEKYFFKIDDSVHESIQILDKLIKKEMIKINISSKDTEILGVSNELSQVLINLIKNSIDSFVQNKIKNRQLDIIIKKENSFAIIEIQDNAGGIQENSIDAIFEPYFTTKHKSQGTGLGLFMSKMICEHGFNGSLKVKSKQAKTTFYIKIPIERKNEK